MGLYALQDLYVFGLLTVLKLVTLHLDDDLISVINTRFCRSLRLHLVVTLVYHGRIL